MAIASVAMQAYQKAAAAQKAFDQKFTQRMGKPEAAPAEAFSTTLKGSLEKVKDLQSNADSMVKSFAAGETENVHELMISLQKASMAMSLTSAVRGKVLSAYQEIMRMPF